MEVLSLLDSNLLNLKVPNRHCKTLTVLERRIQVDLILSKTNRTTSQ